MQFRPFFGILPSLTLRRNIPRGLPNGPPAAIFRRFVMDCPAVEELYKVRYVPLSLAP